MFLFSPQNELNYQQWSAKSDCDYKCEICGMKESEHRALYFEGLCIHHIYPRRQNGDEGKGNYLICCKDCHKIADKVNRQIFGHRKAG